MANEQLKAQIRQREANAAQVVEERGPTITAASAGAQAQVANGPGTRVHGWLHGGWGAALVLFVVLRLGLSFVAWLATLLDQPSGPCAWDGGPTLHAAGLDFALVGMWQRWDACWYAKIATIGYQPHDPSVAFFPLYPALMRLTGFAFGGNVALGGLVVSALAYVAAMAGLYKLVRTDFDDGVASRTVLYVSVFPTAFFMFAPFTEALFLALSVWCLYAARRGLWEQSGVAGLFGALTRLQGGVLAAPIAWEWFRQWRARTAGEGRRITRGDMAKILVALAPPVGFALFILYSRKVAGTTAFQVESVWGHQFRLPWQALAASWRHIRDHSDAIEGFNLVALLLFSAILVAGAWRLPFAYTLFAAPQLLLLALRETWFSPLMSTSRYVLVLFPVFVVLALLGRRRWFHYAWMIFSLLLLGVLLHAFFNGTFVA